MGKPVKEVIREDVEFLKNKVEELRKKAAPGIEKGRQFVAKEEKEVEAYIRAHPLKSVGLAFTLGFLVGKLKR